MNHLVSTCAIALLTSGLAAQSFFIPDSSTAGGSNVIPFGHNRANIAAWGNQLYQQLVTATDLGSPVAAKICELAFVPQVSGIRRFSTIEITLAQTNATALSTTFSANLSANVQTVLKATNYAWDNTVVSRWTRIGLEKDYLYLSTFGANLVIQIHVTGAYLDTTSTTHPGYSSASRERLFAYNWTGSAPATGTWSATSGQKIEVIVANPDLQAFGTGCPGSNSKTPRLGFAGSAQLGQQFSIDLADALPTALVLHVVGINRIEPAVDLALINAPNCMLYESVDILVAGLSDAAGAYSLKTTMPNDNALICFRVYTQFFPMDTKANGWGYTASNYGRILPAK